MSIDKNSAIEASLAHINKIYGVGSVMKMGQRQNLNVEVISTGSLFLDLALDIGGFPKGRIIEIYGPEGSGKTTLALHCIAEAQKRGGTCAFIDAEHALNPVFAKKLGVNIKDLIISQPDNGEQALEIVEILVRSGAIEVIVVDSVATLTPQAEIDGEMGDSHMGLQARLMSQALRKITGAIAKKNCIVIFINQLRMKIGVMFGNPETTTGGRALGFHASIRLDIRKIENIVKQDKNKDKDKDKDKDNKKSDNNVIGQKVKIKIAKNKLGPPLQIVDFDIIYDSGICKNGEILDLGVKFGLLKKEGNWFSYNNEKMGQGRDNAKEYLRNNPEITQKLETQIRKQFALESSPLEIDEEELCSDDTSCLQSIDDDENVSNQGD